MPNVESQHHSVPVTAVEMNFEEPVQEASSSSEVSALLTGILMPPLFILWIAGVYLVRCENDPARVAFSYMKVAFPLAFFAVASQFTHHLLNITVHKIVVSGTDENASDALFDRLIYISMHLSTLSTALLDTTDVFLILTLFELGNGFMLCITGTRSTLSLVVRYAVLVPSALVLSLAVTTYIKGCSIWARSLSADEDNEQRIQQDIEALDRWDTPLLMVWVTASLALLAYATWILNRARGKPLILASAVTFLQATILNLINPARYLIMMILEQNEDVRDIAGGYLDMDDEIVDYWLRFFTLVLVFIIGLRKENGLWASPPRLSANDGSKVNSIKG
ncbi:hypothetical protein ACJZ2D_003368 [Fusarium nematophilum]